MKTTQEWLALVREKLAQEGYASATKYRVAHTLGISEVTVSLWEKGAQMDGINALKIADYLGRDPSEVLISAAWSRAKDAKERAVWEVAAKKAFGVAAQILASGAALLSLHSSDAVRLVSILCQMTGTLPGRPLRHISCGAPLR